MRRAWLVAALVTACGVPALERTGAIRCGPATDPNGGCPDGYLCTAERCCPTGAAGCPSLPLACEGHDVPSFSAGSAPAVCREPVTAGRACTLTGATRCPAGFECNGALTGAAGAFPGGYCTQLACNEAACGAAGGVCIPSAVGQVCAMRCTLPQGEPFARCRDDQPGRYVCAHLVSRSLDATVCVPDCTTTPAACGAGTRCDPRTRACVAGS